MHTTTDWERRLEDVLRGRSTVTLVAQPIVDLAGCDVAGYELLARFDGAETPDRWFAAARELGRGAELDALVLRRALGVRATVPPNRFVTVNVEPDSLASPPVLEALLGEGAPLGGLVIELTEHQPNLAGPEVLAVLDDLREHGAMIAMDDVGTGYAGLTHLLTVRPDLVKVDRELVSGIDTDPARLRLMEVLGDLCGRMDAWMLAEGVETRGEYDVLLELGVPLAQGWFFGRPQPPWAEIDQPLRSSMSAAVARASLTECIAPLTREGDGAGVQVVTDHSGRPVRVRWTYGGHDFTAPAMTMSGATGIVDALQRAITRPEPHRWAPVLVTDGRGRLLGRVDVVDLAARVSSGAARG